MLISHASISRFFIITAKSIIGFCCLVSAHAFGMTGDDGSGSESESSNSGVPPKIPSEFLIPFLRQAVQTSVRPQRLADASSDAQHDATTHHAQRDVDSLDYLRLLNISHLLSARNRIRTSATPEEQRYWFLNLSRQVDALSVYEGSLRELLTPNASEKMFWRRLAYLHHGLSITDVGDEVKSYILDQIWNSGELENLEKLIDVFLERWVKGFRHGIYEHRQHIYKTRGKWLDRLATQVAGQPKPPAERGKSDLKSHVVLSPYLRSVESFKDIAEVIMKRGKQILGSGRMLRDPSNVSNAQQPSIDDLKKAATIHLKNLSKPIEDFRPETEHLRFPNIIFYIGIISEFEHLTIASQYLSGLLSNTTPTAVSIIETIALVGEAFKNISVPLDLNDKNDVLQFRDILGYLRDKVAEHPGPLQKSKLKELTTSEHSERVLQLVRKDLIIINERLENRLSLLKEITNTREHVAQRIEELRIGKADSAVWGNNIPSLQKLAYYFLSDDYSLNSISTPDAAVENKIVRLVSSLIKKQSKKKDQEKKQEESSTLEELREAVERVYEFNKHYSSLDELADVLRNDIMNRLHLFRLLNDVKTSFCYLAENMDSEFFDLIYNDKTVRWEPILWHFYYDLRDRRNLITHDLWRSDVNGLVNTTVRVLNILRPAILAVRPNQNPIQQEFNELITDPNVSFSPTWDLAHGREDTEDLIAQGANLNAIVNAYGDTPLHVTMQKKQYDRAIFLIEHGALPDTKKARGEDLQCLIRKELGPSPKYFYDFDWEGFSSNNPQLRLLYEHFTNIEKALYRVGQQRSGHERGLDADALHAALRAGDEVEVERLIREEGYSCDLYDKLGELPLCLALDPKIDPAKAERYLSLCLSAPHIDVNRTSRVSGDTPLHIAVQRLNTEFAGLLLRHGSSVNSRNKQGDTPLHIVARSAANNPPNTTELSKKRELIKLLLDANADIKAIGWRGLTPFQLCVPDTAGLLEMFIDRGGDPNQNANGQTMLEYAVENGMQGGYLWSASTYNANLRLLLSRGAYPLMRVRPRVSTGWQKPYLHVTNKTNSTQRQPNANTVMIFGTKEQSKQITDRMITTILETDLSDQKKSTLLWPILGDYEGEIQGFKYSVPVRSSLNSTDRISSSQKRLPYHQLSPLDQFTREADTTFQFLQQSIRESFEAEGENTTKLRDLIEAKRLAEFIELASTHGSQNELVKYLTDNAVHFLTTLSRSSDGQPHFYSHTNGRPIYFRDVDDERRHILDDFYQREGAAALKIDEENIQRFFWQLAADGSLQPAAGSKAPTKKMTNAKISEGLHFLVVSPSVGMPEEHIPIVPMEYQYTGQDIHNLLHLNLLPRDSMPIQVGGIQPDFQQFRAANFTGLPLGEDDPAGVIYKIGDRFILPPAESIDGFSLREYVANYVRLIYRDQPFTGELILPYNQGGHWVTVHIRAINNGIRVTYVDSLKGSRSVQDARKGIQGQMTQEGARSDVHQLVVWLRAREGVNVTPDVAFRRTQPDVYACGAMVVENILDIVAGVDEPEAPEGLSHEDIFDLRIDHHTQLLREGQNLDFDIPGNQSPSQVNTVSQAAQASNVATASTASSRPRTNTRASSSIQQPTSRYSYHARTDDFMAAHNVLLNGHQVLMDEYRVGGAGNNCGFTALGLDRAAAIEGLVPQIRDNPDVAEMVREEVRAAFLRGELPQSMRADAQALFLQRGAQADTIDGVLADLRIQFGEQFADIDAAFTYMHGRPNIAAETLQHVNDLITERDGIEREINEHFYTPDALVRFVEEEYVNGPGMLSYIPDQRGTLYALAYVNNIEVHIIENRDGQMQGTFDVPLRVIDPSAPLVYLFHTGGIDEGTGRRYLNHFNLLACLQPEKQTGPSGNGTEPIGQQSTLPAIHQAFLTYYARGLDELLPLRVQMLNHIEPVRLANSQWLKHSSQQSALPDDVVTGLANGDTVLIPYNLWGQHWVGVALERDADGQITVNYMDPENKPMPRELRVQLIAALSGYSHVHVAQIPVEQQRYNNCGPEVIENFVWYLNGNRATQEEAVPLHSWLLQQRLMPLDETTPRRVAFLDPHARFDEKLAAQLQHYVETGEILYTLQQAINDGVVQLTTEEPRHVVARHNETITEERPYFGLGILDEKLVAQMQHYAEEGEMFHTLQNAVGRGLAYFGIK